MKILTINSGSSSVKYKLINTQSAETLCKGVVERIGAAGTSLAHKRPDGEKHHRELQISDHKGAIDSIIDILTDSTLGVIRDLDEIDAVGHRLVHGGDRFSQSVLIDRQVLATLRECIDFAPLHNPPNIKGVEASEAELPGKPNVGVFDTAFHSSIPDYAYTYAIPFEYFEKDCLRRYGFHGTSHYFVAHRAAAMMAQDIEQLKIITCHLGNGASITAVQQGQSVDTSMGFTPLEGLVMGTRSGDIDPGVIFYIAEKENFSIPETNNFLNKRCGLLGISGLTNDMRDIEEQAMQGNPRARLALKVFCYRIKKYIAAYMGIMNGADAIVFTGGIGENSDIVRREALANMDYIGLEIDPQKNGGLRGKESFLQTDNSSVKILVIPTNEEMVIAKETERILEVHTATN